MVSLHKNSPAVEALHLEHLIIQRDHLLFVRDRHLHWMSETKDPEIRDLHQEIADLLEEAASRYENILVEITKRRDQTENSSL